MKRWLVAATLAGCGGGPDVAAALVGSYDYATPTPAAVTTCPGGDMVPSGMVYVTQIGDNTITTNQLTQLVAVTPTAGNPCTPTLIVDGATSTMKAPLVCGVTFLADDSTGKLEWQTYTLTSSAQATNETYAATMKLTLASGTCDVTAQGRLVYVPQTF